MFSQLFTIHGLLTHTLIKSVTYCKVLFPTLSHLPSMLPIKLIRSAGAARRRARDKDYTFKCEYI